MKAITIRQPYASLIARGVKTVETRSWATHYRGRIAIHAAAGWAPGWLRWHDTGSPLLGALSDVDCGMSEDPNGSYSMRPHRRGLHLGAVIATATLADCLPMVELPPYVSIQNENAPEADEPYRKLPRNYIAVGAEAVWLVENGGRYVSQRAFPLSGEALFGDYQPGRFGWLLTDVEPITPTPAKGRLGLWDFHAADSGVSQ